jgi:hypothetical protein
VCYRWQISRYIVWENVPGAFSSNKGEDFRCVLESICRIKDETLSVPKADKWRQAGNVMGDNFSIAGECLTLNMGSSQRRNASSLSQILQERVPEKYYLSQKACLGILRRASDRGKELPIVLKTALERQTQAV